MKRYGNGAELFRADAQRMEERGEHEYAAAALQMAEWCEKQPEVAADWFDKPKTGATE